MRLTNQLLPAGAAAGPLPFAGLGFATAEVRQAAATMAPLLRTSCAEPAVVHAVCGPAVSSGGYKLLVALSREIRGR